MINGRPAVAAAGLCVVLAAGAAGPCGPGNGDCCLDNGTPGCEDLVCCNAVCGVDPFCCGTAWDPMCADLALALCPRLCLQGVPVLPGQGLTFSQVNLTYPGAEWIDSPYGLATADYQMLAASTGIPQGFLNVTTGQGWVVRNLPVDAATDFPGVSTFFDLGQEGPVAQLQAHALLTVQALPDFNAPPDAVFNVGKADANAQGLHAPRALPPLDPVDVNVVNFNVPGADRRTFQQLHPNQQQKLNQCGPASVANSLQWLEDHHGITVPDDHDKGQLDGTLMGKLDKRMRRKQNQVVRKSKDFLRGKLKYIRDRNLADDLTIRHKERPGLNWIGNNMRMGAATSQEDTTNTSLIDWIISQIQDGENVEIQVMWDNGSGHFLDLSAGGYTRGRPWIVALQDNVQGDNTRGTTNADGGFIHAWVKDNTLVTMIRGRQRRAVINLAVSESPTGEIPAGTRSACTCPLGGNLEPEACGDDANGGCDAAVPAFDPVQCGDTVCGTLWADGGAADSDWFSLEVPDEDGDGEAEVSVVIASALPVDVALLDAGDCGAPVILDAAVSPDCDTLTTVGAVVAAPGTYAVRVQPDSVDGFPCGGLNAYVLTTACTDVIDPCGDPKTGDCFTPHETPGCLDAGCCGQVRFADSFCVTIEWDETCVGEALVLCGGDDSMCGPGAGNCAAEHETPGCADPACCATVCAEDPTCCVEGWDVLCVQTAVDLCETAPCPWDLDADGIVGVLDFLILLAEWGPNPNHPADIDDDGTVGITDFLTLLSHWGACP